jgi:hypothetical protein
MFSEEKDRYTLDVSQLQSPDELNTGLWVVLAGINEIPPHIALIQEGKYYSVTTNRVKVDEPVEKILKAISRKNLPTIFVRIKSNNEPILSEELGEAFSVYPTLGNGEHSCLSPISDFFAKTYSAEFGNKHLVFDVLSLAQKKGMLVEGKALYTDNLDNGVLHLSKYSHEQIRNKINSILKVNE